MKKLIVLSVIFALLASAAFAGDISVSGAVGGTVTVAEGSTGKTVADGTDFKAPDATSGAGLGRIRIEVSGDNETFGGWVRADGGSFYGHAWWKPMDMLKILVGSNGYDGFIGREGVTGWGFHQTVTDTGVGWGGAGVWDPNIYGITSMFNFGKADADNPYGTAGSLTYRDAFFEGGGDGANALYLFITPTDTFGINVILPFFNGGKTADVFGKAVVQADVKLEGMSFSLTYQGGLGYKDASDDYAETWEGKKYFNNAGNEQTSTTEFEKKVTGDALKVDPGKLFLYANLGMVENLGIDIGVGYTLPGSMMDGDVTISAPIAAGLGVKYDMGDFKVKFRTVASFGGSVKVEGYDDPYVPGFGLLLEVLPYFAVNENLTVFAGIGYGMKGKDKAGGEEIDETDQSGFSFNPYIVVGEEWGPKFIAGIKIWQSNAKDEAGAGKKYINWAVPIALCVGF